MLLCYEIRNRDSNLAVCVFVWVSVLGKGGGMVLELELVQVLLCFSASAGRRVSTGVKKVFSSNLILPPV